MTPMVILGIDPGLKTTGYGFIDFEDGRSALLEAGIIEPNPKDFLPHKLTKVYQILDQLIGRHKPSVMVLEKLYAHYKHPATAFVLGHVRGVICLLCAERNVTLIEQSVKRIRQTLTGYGSASKQQTQRMVAHMLKIDEHKLTLDSSDALALALGYVNLMRVRLP